MRPHSEIMRECHPTEVLEKRSVQTFQLGTIDISPVKCVVDGETCVSGRCPIQKAEDRLQIVLVGENNSNFRKLIRLALEIPRDRSRSRDIYDLAVNLKEVAERE